MDGDAPAVAVIRRQFRIGNVSLLWTYAKAFLHVRAVRIPDFQPKLIGRRERLPLWLNPSDFWVGEDSFHEDKAISDKIISPA